MRNTGNVGGKALTVALVMGGVVVLLLAVGLLTSGRGGAASPSAGQSGPGKKPSAQVGPTIVNFTQEVRSEQTNELEALITGAQAVRVEEKAYEIESPKVESYPSAATAKSGTEGSFGKVDITSKNARFDQQKSIVNMQESVKVIGTDFDIAAEQVTYLVAERKVNSTVPVEINRYRIGPDQKKELAMRITGTGMDVDMTLQKMVVYTGVKATLFNVSQDFMAGGGAQNTGGSQQVVITSDGAMTYENVARRATFDKNAVAVTGEKVLKGDTLVISLGKSEGPDTLQVSSIKADGNVEFKNVKDTAYGASLVWDNVTQAGVITGKAARMVTTDFVITGEKLTFFRLNSRFQADGPGKLVWTPPAKGGASAAQKKPAPGLLAPGEPLEVVWAGGMTYDSKDMSAVFSKEVRAAQKTGTLASESLEVQFNSKDRSIKQVLARENVHLVQTVQGVQRTVDCDRAEWDAAASVTKFTAAPGKQLTVSTGQEKLVSSVVVFDPNKDVLDCKAPGTLDIAAARPLGGGNKEPTKVKWDTSMRYARSGQRAAEFEGAVQMSQAGQIMKGDSMRVDFDEKENPVKVTARKNALLEVLPREEAKPGEAPKPAGGEPKEKKAPVMPSLTQAPEHWRLSADVIVGHPKEETIQTEGPGLLELFHKEGLNDSVRYGKSVMVNFLKSLAEFKGDVEAKFSGSTIQCESLRLEFGEKNELRHMYCEENVRFTAPGENPWKMSAKSAEAIFAAGSVLSQVIARDNVEVLDAERTVKAQLLTLFFEEGKGSKGSSLSRATAKKDVSVHYGGDKKIDATADDLLWDVESGLYTLLGNPATVSQAGFGTKGEKILIDRKNGKMTVPAGKTPATTTVEGGAK